MDRQARRLKEDQKGDGSDDDDSGAGSDQDEEGLSKLATLANGGGPSALNGDTLKDPNTKTRCENCFTTATGQFHTTAKGVLCRACYGHWRRTGSMKVGSHASPRLEPTRNHMQLLAQKSKRKPPRGMYCDIDDLKAISHGPPGHGELILKNLDEQVVNLKRQVQNNKQTISQLKHKLCGGIAAFRPARDG